MEPAYKINEDTTYGWSSLAGSWVDLRDARRAPDILVKRKASSVSVLED
jgi:hypothetical protein